MAIDWGLAQTGLNNQYDYLDSMKQLQAIGGQAIANQTNRFQLQQAQRQAEIRPLIAQRIASGDIAGAQQQALSSGDMESFKGVNDLHDQHLQQLDRESEALGSTAYSLRQITDPTQRAAAFQQAIPYLKQQGFSDQEIAANSGNLSDQSLDQFITHAQGVKAAVQTELQKREQAQADQRIQLAQQAQTLDQQKFDYEKTKPLSVGFGTSLVSPTGRVIYDGNGMGAGTGGDTSRLINSEAGGGYVPDNVQTLGDFVDFGKALNQKGAKSSAAGTYQITGSTMAEFAPKALGANWQTQPFNADSQDKVGEAIFNWAKSQPNPAAALKGRWVSLDNRTAAQLVQGSWNQAKGVIAQGETGGGAGASAGGGAGGMSAAAIDLAAREGLAHGGVVPSGYARNRAAQAAITNRMAELNAGGDVGNLIQKGQTTKSQGAAYQQWNGRNGGAVATRSLSVAVDHIDQLGIAAQALQNGNVPLFNRVTQAYAQQTGAAAPTNFNALKQFVSDEVTKAIIGAGGGVADRQEAGQILANWNSPAQTQGAINALHGLMAGQLHGLDQQYQATTGRNDFTRYVSPRAQKVLGLNQQQPSAPAGWKITRVN